MRSRGKLKQGSRVLTITGREMENIGVMLKKVVKLAVARNLATDDWDPPKMDDSAGEEDEEPPGDVGSPALSDDDPHWGSPSPVDEDEPKAESPRRPPPKLLCECNPP
eukprot:4274519-Lingulodinium_polyedra.AAC.1